MRKCPFEVDVPAVLRRRRWLPAAFCNKVLDFRRFALVFLLRFAFINEMPRANILFTVEKIKFFRMRAWECRLNQFTIKRRPQRRDKGSFEKCRCRLPAWPESNALCKKAAEVQQYRYAILEGSGAFAKAAREVLQSLDYSNALPESSFEEFLRFMHSTFDGEETLKEKVSRKLLNPIICAGDERRDKKERDTGRAPYTSNHKLPEEHLENGGDPV